MSNALFLAAIVGMFIGCDAAERYSLGATTMVPLATFVLGLDSQLSLPTNPTPLISMYLLALIVNCLLAMLASNMQTPKHRLAALGHFLFVHAAINAWAAWEWSGARSDRVDLIPPLSDLLRADGGKRGTATMFGRYSGGDDWEALTLSVLEPAWSCTKSGCKAA